MIKEDIKFLDDNRSIYTTLVNAGFMQNLTNEVRQEFLNIIRRNINPGYLCCMHCSEDVAAMVKYVYVQFDKIPREEVKKNPKTKSKQNGASNNNG